MSQTKMAQKQMTLAITARDNPRHRFTNLYSLMHWDYWIRCAADAVLARPGSTTAGVDGHTREAFQQRDETEIRRITAELKHQTYEPLPVRRVLIPKSNGRMRPLGIPALRDRIVQEALRALLDPIYESDFYQHSYGFRKGRCTMDAVAAMMPLFQSNTRYYYVIEGDIESYFDTLQHRKLLSILKRRIADQDILELIWKFLKAGVMEGGLFARTETGVPQGGGISPLLANVYLNEFDRWAEERWNYTYYERHRRRLAGKGHYQMFRYADDFVVVSNDGIAGVREAKEEIKTFLETELHLKLSDDKTKITHVNAGFEFLGFHIQRLQPEGRWVLYCRPTERSKERIKAKIKDLTSRGWTWRDEYTQLAALNTVVRGWAGYYRHTSLLKDIADISFYTWARYLIWLKAKHKGSRAGQLIQAKCRVIHNRKRWTAELREGDQTLTTYQWMPTRLELKRRRYLRKGKNGFPHPYIYAEEPTFTDYPMGETGPAENLYHTPTRHPKRGEPLEYGELTLRAKARDHFQCVRCGSRESIQIHHSKGLKSHRLEDLETLCLPCHQAETRQQCQYQ